MHKHLLYFFTWMLVSCDAPLPEGALLQDYTWKDSIIRYAFHRDSLVITFPKQPETKS